MQAGHVLVTCDNDFRSQPKDLNLTKRQYRTQLNCIMLRGDPTRAKDRVIDALSIIEAEFSRAHAGAPMRIDINDVSIRINR